MQRINVCNGICRAVYADVPFPFYSFGQGFSKVVEAVAYRTPKERKSVARRAAARGATLFLSFLAACGGSS